MAEQKRSKKYGSVIKSTGLTYVVTINEHGDFTCTVNYSFVNRASNKIVCEEEVDYPGIVEAVMEISDCTGYELTQGIPCIVKVADDTVPNAVSIYKFLSDNPRLSFHPHICDYTCGEYYIVELIAAKKTERPLRSESLELCIYPFDTHERAEMFCEMTEMGVKHD